MPSVLLKSTPHYITPHLATQHHSNRATLLHVLLLQHHTKLCWVSTESRTHCMEHLYHDCQQLPTAVCHNCTSKITSAHIQHCGHPVSCARRFSGTTFEKTHTPPPSTGGKRQQESCRWNWLRTAKENKLRDRSTLRCNQT